MKTIEVFDPAMCCSTGVCVPSVDPALARFAADLDWLGGQGVSVERFNLAQQPGGVRRAGACQRQVRGEGRGVSAARPRRRAGGQRRLRSVACRARGHRRCRAADHDLHRCSRRAGRYRRRGRLQLRAMPRVPPRAGAELGVADEAIAQAVKTARKVKETPARSILRAADESLLGTLTSQAGAGPQPGVVSNGGCCSSGDAETDVAVTQAGSSSCC